MRMLCSQLVSSGAFFYNFIKKLYVKHWWKNWGTGILLTCTLIDAWSPLPVLALVSEPICLVEAQKEEGYREIW